MKQGNFNQQAGFTLIELIMVIVILGILSAFALPRFADLGGEARTSSIQAASGAVRSAANIAHAQWLAQGSTGDVSLEGVTITMTTGGYPNADSAGVTGSAATTNGIVEAAQLSDADYTLAVATGVLTVSIATNCSFTYTESTGAVSAVTTSGC